MKRKINISIDDASPHPLSSINVVNNCMEVLQLFPDVKFTLFVPTAYWRTVLTPGRLDTRTDKPLFLKDHPDFCHRLRSLPKENFEVCYHGRHHGLYGISNNDEMRYLDTQQYLTLLNNMQQDVIDAGLFDVFKPIVRPPAMYMSPAAIDASSHLSCLALSPRELHTKGYSGADKRAKNVVYANMWFPDDSLDAVPLFVNLEFLYHACEWDKGYFDRQRRLDLCEWLKNNEVEFCFIEGLL